MTNHQGQPALARQLVKRLGLGEIEAERLLDEYVPTRLERLAGECAVGRRRRGYGNRLHYPFAQQRIEARMGWHVIGGCPLGPQASIALTERGKRAERLEIAQQVLAPIAGADNTDRRAFSRRSPLR